MRKKLEEYYGKEVHIVGYPRNYDKDRDYIVFSPVFVLDNNNAYYVDHIWCSNSSTIKPQPAVYQGVIAWYTKKDTSEDYAINELQFVQLNPYKSLDDKDEDQPLVHPYHATIHEVTISTKQSQRNLSIIRQFESGTLNQNTSNSLSLKVSPLEHKSWLINKQEDEESPQIEKLKSVLKDVPLTKIRTGFKSSRMRLILDKWHLAKDDIKPEDLSTCLILFGASTDRYYHWCTAKYNANNDVFYDTNIEGLETIKRTEIHSWQYLKRITIFPQQFLNQNNDTILDNPNALKQSLINYKKALLYHDKNVHTFGRDLVELLGDPTMLDHYINANDIEKDELERTAYTELMNIFQQAIDAKKREMDSLMTAMQEVEQTTLDSEEIENRIKTFIANCNISLPNCDRKLPKLTDQEFYELIKPYHLVEGYTYWDILLRNEVIRRDGNAAIKRYITNDDTVIQDAINHLQKRIM